MNQKPIWLGSAATFTVTVDLLPGATNMDMTVSCPDATVARPIGAYILPDDSGWLSYASPLFQWLSNDGQVMRQGDAVNTRQTLYGDMVNSHPTDHVTITVVASVKAIATGDHACKLIFNANPTALSQDLNFTSIDPAEVS